MGKEDNERKISSNTPHLIAHAPEEYKTIREVYKLLGYRNPQAMRNAINGGRLDELPAYRPEGTWQYLFKLHEVKKFNDDRYRAELEESRAPIGDLRRSSKQEAVDEAVQTIRDGFPQ